MRRLSKNFHDAVAARNVAVMDSKATPVAGQPVLAYRIWANRKNDSMMAIIGL